MSTDDSGKTIQKAFTLAVNDIPEAPTAINLSSLSFNENIIAGSVVATISTVDEDSTSFTYSLVSGDGSDDNNHFAIVGFAGDKLMIKNIPNYETKSSYSIRIMSKNESNETREEKFTLTVNDIPESDITLNKTSFDEFIPAGSEVATISTIDNDSTNFTYSLVSGDSEFDISGDKLKIKKMPNYATKSTYNIIIMSTDDSGKTIQKAFTLNVTDLPENMNKYTKLGEVPNGEFTAPFDYSLGDIIPGKDLTGSNLSGVVLKDADLTGANLSGVDLKDADLTGANLSGVDFSGVNLSRTDLSGATLNFYGQVMLHPNSSTPINIPSGYLFLVDGSVKKIVNIAPSDIALSSYSFRDDEKTGYVIGNLLSVDMLTCKKNLWKQLGVAIHGEASYDESGFSLAMSDNGSRVVIGAPYNYGVNGEYSGNVRIGEWNGTSWVPVGTAIDGEGGGDETGYSVAMSADGTRIVVGAPFNTGVNGSNSGHARVFHWNGISWSQVGSDIDGDDVDDNSGYSVAMSADGTRIAVGANYNNGVNGSNSGHVKVYVWNGTSWVQVGTDIDGEGEGDESGYSITMSANGSRIAIGAPFNTGVNGTESGHVRVFEWNGTSWVKLGPDVDGEGAMDHSGWSIAMSADGSRIAVGALDNVNDNGIKSGHVKIFDWNETSWVQVGADIDGEGEGDEAGGSIAMSADGSRIAICAHLKDRVVNDYIYYDIGNVRVFDWNGTSWEKVGAEI
jgi:hypothetical protein